jgi:hypothetical protein
MKHFHTVVLHLAAVFFLIGTYSLSLDAQDISTASQSDSISVSIALENNRVPVGKSPLVFLTVKNLTDRDVPLHTSVHMYRVHVQGPKGEPPTTLLQRRITGKLLPGESIGRGDEVVFPIPPSESKVKEFELVRYHDLSVLGKYTVYIEVYDESGKWLHTNTAQFEIVAPTQ